jgi:hypothetical protein
LGGPGAADGGVACNERQVQREGGGDDQRVERVAGEHQRVGCEYLIGREVQGLIRRAAEQVVEELLRAAAQVDATHTGEQARLPDDCHGHIDDRFARLAALEQAPTLTTEPA